MKTASAKAKGRSLAKKIAAWLVECATLDPKDVQVTSSGVTGPDVTFSKAGADFWNLAIECKKHASFAVYQHYDQAKDHVVGEEIPVLFIEANRREPLVVMDAEDFLYIYAGYKRWLKG